MNKKAFIKYHEVDLFDFKKYIESIGFIYDDFTHRYKEYRIDLDYDCYDFYDGSKWWCNKDYKDYNDFTPLEKEFKRELRSIKLKQLLR